MSSIDELRVAAKEAVRQARIAENVSCYWDGTSGTFEKSEETYNAALKAIDALAAAVKESAGDIEKIMEVTK